jgi:hypothetical protein
MRTFLSLLFLFISYSSFSATLESPSFKQHVKMRMANSINDEHHVIRIGIFYTNDLVNSLSKEQLSNYLDRQINAANVVMENSGLSIRREVAYVGLYPIDNSSMSIQEFLATIYDNETKPVHDIAEQFGLDYITILRPHIGNSFCGWAYYTEPYAVIEVGGNCTSETLGAHEWGHNDGADHDIANSSDVPVRDYGRGYNCGGEGTIMSTSNNWFDRHSFYSSPNKYVNNEVCGQVDTADVTRMLYELQQLPDHLGNRRPTPINLAKVRFKSVKVIDVNEGDTTDVELVLVDENDSVIALDRTVSIELVSVSDTAIGNLDYEEVAQRITFMAGESLKKVTININADNESEAQEQFQLKLRHGGIITPSNETVSINIAGNSGSTVNYNFDIEKLTLAANDTVVLTINRQAEYLFSEDLLIGNTVKGLTIESDIVMFSADQSSQQIILTANDPLEEQKGNIELFSMLTNDIVATLPIVLMVAKEPTVSTKKSGGSMPLVMLFILFLRLCINTQTKTKTKTKR